MLCAGVRAELVLCAGVRAELVSCCVQVHVLS